MIQTNTIGSFTELYIGGGNFFTQSKPTYFHKFYTQKMLTAGETIDDYMEVTPAQKAQIEAHDATFEEPPQVFLDMTKNCGVVYNSNTGYFTLNGLTDLTYNQMLVIFNEKVEVPSEPSMRSRWFRSTIRTNIVNKYSISVADYSYAFYECTKLEVADCPMMHCGDSAFLNCESLRIIKRMYYLNPNSNKWDKTFYNCFELEEIENFKLSTTTLSSNLTVSFAQSPKLNLKTFNTLVTSAKDPLTKVLNLEVHPDVYAKITGDETNDAYNSLTDDEKEQWTALLESAAEKNIQFTTT